MTEKLDKLLQSVLADLKDDKLIGYESSNLVLLTMHPIWKFPNVGIRK